jgi:hypothetical protein
LNEAYKNLPNKVKLSEMLVNINKSVLEGEMAPADPINRLVGDVNFKPKKVSLDKNIFVLRLNKYGKRIKTN